MQHWQEVLTNLIFMESCSLAKCPNSLFMDPELTGDRPKSMFSLTIKVQRSVSKQTSVLNMNKADCYYISLNEGLTYCIDKDNLNA